MKLRGAFLLSLLMLCLGTLAFADEGMWLFNAFPKDKVQAKYGFAPIRRGSITYGFLRRALQTALLPLSRPTD